MCLSLHDAQNEFEESLQNNFWETNKETQMMVS